MTDDRGLMPGEGLWVRGEKEQKITYEALAKCLANLRLSTHISSSMGCLLRFRVAIDHNYLSLHVFLIF